MTKEAAVRVRARRGATVIEALVALLLTALLLQTSWSVTAAARRGVAQIVARSEALETERVGANHYKSYRRGIF